MSLGRRLSMTGLLGGMAALAGCTSIGPRSLNRDQLDYTRAISESSKRQTLFNLVRMRYGDAPSFVAINQLVSSYSLQSSGSGGFGAFQSSFTRWGLLGGLQYTDTPTFTLQPVVGDQFVEAYLRPLAPDEVLPLIQSGIPANRLFWLALQSIGPLQNSQPLGRGRHTGSPEFYQALDLIRQVQDAGGLGVEVRKTKDRNRAFLIFDTRHLPHMAPLVQQIYRLLRVSQPSSSRLVEVFYGHDGGPAGRAAIPIMTRSLLGVMAAISAEIEVPQADVEARRTLQTLREPGDQRHVLSIQSGAEPPPRAYAAVQIEETWFWVADNDMSSKLTFSILQLLKAIAESTQDTSSAVLTIPTR